MKNSKKIAKKRVIKKPYKKAIKKQTNNNYVSKHGKVEKKVRIRYGRLIIFFIVLFLIMYLFFTYVKIPIKNIYVKGNTTLTDQEIIDASGLRDYPSVLSFTNYQIEKKLTKNINIQKATVKKNFRKVTIEIEENYGLFYDSELKKTIMDDGRTSDIKDVPTLVNHVTEDTYKLFIEKMKLLKRNVIDRISEIKYDPNEVDEERFLFYMNDGNYVYITLEKIETLNDYVDIIKTFENKKGILYLDSGEYFEMFEN